MRKLKTLKKNYEFKNVLSKGKYIAGKYVILYYKKNRKNENYVGIAVSTKVGKAVKRNKIKRLIRENYRLCKENLKNNYDFVFLWNKKANIENANFFVIKEEMQKILEKADLLK